MPPPATQSPAQGTLSFSFTIPKKSSGKRRAPAYVSASTQGIVVAVTSQSTQQTSTVVLACSGFCSGSLAAPAGVDTVAFRLLDKPPVGSPPSKDPSAKVLAIGTTVTLVVPDTDNVIHATLDGVVKNVTTAFAPATVNAGAPANTFLIVNAYDPDDNLITLDGAWSDANGNPVAVDVTAPLPNVYGGVSGNVVTVSAPGAVIPVTGTFPAGTYSFTATLRSGAPTVTTIAPAALLAQPNVAFGTTPFFDTLSPPHAFTLGNGNVGLGFVANANAPQSMVGDVLGRTIVAGPPYPSQNALLPYIVVEPGVIDFAALGGGDQGFVLASSAFVAANAPACANGSLAVYSGPIDPSTGATPYTVCWNPPNFFLQSATQSYPLGALDAPIPAAFIASPKSNANAWCSAPQCLIIGGGGGGSNPPAITAVVTDGSANTGNTTTYAAGLYAAYDVDHAVAITPQGAVYQIAAGGGSTKLYQSAVPVPDSICVTSDGTATVVLGTGIAGGIAQPQVGVYRNGAETVGPVPPSPGHLEFVPGANCKFAFDGRNVDGVLF